MKKTNGTRRDFLRTGAAAQEWHPDDEVKGEPWKPKLDTRHIRDFVEAVRAGLTLHVDTKNGIPAEKEAMKYWSREYAPGWGHC